jgi:hypothetical protein
MGWADPDKKKLHRIDALVRKTLICRALHEGGTLAWHMQ